MFNLSFEVIFNVHLWCSIFMTGLIWIVQLVHYPSFRFVSSSDFVDFEKFHTSSISLIVLPVMLLELVTGVWICAFEMNLVYLINLIALGGIWLTTFLLSVPCHTKLGVGKDMQTIDKLVKTNWIRTILWSGKGFILLLV